VTAGGRATWHGRAVVVLLAGAGVVALAATVAHVRHAGRGSADHPVRLVDGSAAPPVPPRLTGVAGGAVRSRLRIRRVAALGRAGRACLTRFRGEFAIAPSGVVVERTGALGATLTLADAGARFVLGCDRTARDPPAAWCAHAVGRRRAGALTDPRADVLCRDRHGRPVGFAWVEPAASTRWVVVRAGGTATLEPVAAGLPVRVATPEVDVVRSRVSAEVLELGSDGEEVRAYRLDAAVAG
jgi:hypothetical protein